MKKRTAYLLLLIGNLCMSLKLFTSSFLNLSESATDFLKGMGIVFVIYSCALIVRQRRAATQNENGNC